MKEQNQTIRYRTSNEETDPLAVTVRRLKAVF